jgi:DNA polymerase III epsilon subunit-like protein
MNYFILHDKETGDLDPKKGDALTAYYAVVECDTFRVVEELYLKLKPDGDRMPMANPDALRVNGIDLRLHMSDPETITYSEARPKIKALIAKYREPGRYSNLRFLGHNVDFDLGFEYEYLLTKEELDKLVHYVTADTKRAVDFLKDCGWLPKSIGTLVSCVEYFNIPKRAAHNAKEDSLMTLEVYKKLVAMMEAKKSGGASQDLISLLEAE